MDRETIIQEIRRVAQELGSSTLSKVQFKLRSNISEYHINKYFDSWNEAVKAANLTVTDVSRISDDEIFREMAKAFEKCGEICSTIKFNKLCKYSYSLYRSRFGKWNDTLLAFKAWLSDSNLDFKFKDQLPIVPIPVRNSSTLSKEIDKSKQIIYDSVGTTAYGSVLNFRGLLHAPVNEQGVVFLFGMVCLDLGFIVEAVQTGYPDCIAKRRVKGKKDIWERVRIEFEYRSSNFNHKPDGCDLIVCWEHDWPGCPNEVLELKTAIKSLSS